MNSRFQYVFRAFTVALFAALLVIPPAQHAEAQSGPPGDGPRKGKPGGGGRRGQGPPPGARGGMNPGGEFNAATFTCFEYMSASGENATNRAQGLIARISIEANIAGLNQARGTLALGAAPADKDAMTIRIAETCANRPMASMLSVGVTDEGADALKIPSVVVPGLALDTYTCGEHLEGKKAGSGDAVRADIAEMWAFAFIQGYKLAGNAELIIPAQNKPMLVGAVAKACAGRPEAGFLAMTAQVAERVKIQ